MRQTLCLSSVGDSSEPEAPVLHWGPPLAALGLSLVTPLAALFVRHHGAVPTIDPASFALRVDGLVDKPLVLSLNALRHEFPPIEVVAALQCAGNRRRELSAVGELPGEILWDAEAIGTARWRGARLADVCARAGVASDAAHVVLEGCDAVPTPRGEERFAVSIPLDKALASETILAYEVNGAALPVVHGAPLRAIVPGYIGARSVKWLGRIRLEREPSASYHQRRAYRMLEHGAPRGATWDSSSAIDGVRVTSAICSPLDGSVVTERPVRLRGYAVPGEGASIGRVVVSADAGASWQTASLAATPSVWAWRLWKATLDLSPGVHTLTVCATDSTGAAQPADLSSVWNARGYMNNAWHRITIRVV